MENSCSPFTDNILIELQKVFHSFSKDGLLDVSDAQKACWKFGVYPSKSQVQEMIYCNRNDASHALEFHEFCVLIASVINYLRKPNMEDDLDEIRKNSFSKSDCKWEVFLGGACNPTTWRSENAIPYLKEEQVTFYNPQVSTWSPQLIEVETFAKASAQVLLFVISWQTRGLASLVEVAHLAGLGRNLILIVPDQPPKFEDISIAGEKILPQEYDSMCRAHLFLTDLVERQGIPVFTDLSTALRCVKYVVERNCNVRDLTEEDGAVPVKHPFVKVGKTFATLKEVFRSLDHLKTGKINHAEADMGLRILLGHSSGHLHTAQHNMNLHHYSFSDFCLLYTREVLFNRHSADTEETALNSQPNGYPKCDFLIGQSHPDGNKTGDASSLNNLERGAAARPYQSRISSCVNTFLNFLSFQWLTRLFVRSSSPTTSLKYKNAHESNDDRQHRMNHRASRTPSVNSGRLRAGYLSLSRHYEYDVFLGGSCGVSQWRTNTAIPMLRRAGITFYNPQVKVATWCTRLLPAEEEAREKSRVFLYVITKDSYSTANLIEVSYYIGRGYNVIMYVELFDLPSTGPPPFTPITLDLPENSWLSASRNSNPELFTQTSGPLAPNLPVTPPDSHSPSIIDESNLLSIAAVSDHNRGRQYLIDLANRAGVPVAESLTDALQLCIEEIRRLRANPLLTPLSGVTN